MEGTNVFQAPNGSTATVVGISIVDGVQTFTVRDADKADCTTTVTVTPPAPCSTGDPCVGQGGDADGDGVCANNDCDDNNPNISAPGDACDDGNPNTENDEIQNDCSCAGTPVSTTCDVIITTNASEITVSGLTAPITSVKIIDLTWNTLASCDDWTTPCAATEVFSVPAGTYYVQVKTYLDWSTPVCDLFETVVLGGGDPCAGNGGDADGDGICANEDCNDFDSNVGGQGSACDDGNPNTINDAYDSNCDCVGQPNNDPCAYQGGDADGDGVCADNDCDDNNPNIGGQGSACDDGDPNTVNDAYDANCNCAGTPQGSCDVVITVDGSKITVSNLTAPITAVKFLDNTWNELQGCNAWTTPCGDMEMFTAPGPGTYFVQVQTYADWSTPICDIFETIVIHDTPVCDNVTDGGAIEGDETGCEGYDPAPILSTALPSGGSGEIEYLWLASTNGCPGSLSQAIPGATNASYDPGPITQTTYYRRCSRRAGCTGDASWFNGESDCVVKTVEDCTPVCDNVTDGGAIEGDETGCEGYDPAPILSTALPSGGSGEIEYLWLASTNGCPGSLSQAIPGATNSTYDPGPITQTTYYRRCSRRAGCTGDSSWFNGESDCVVKTVEACSNLCADRNISDSQASCGTGSGYSFYAKDLITGINGVSARYSLISGTFEEYNDGTARLVGRVQNSGNNSVKFDLDVVFTGRTLASVGSPKGSGCYTIDDSDWYYYTTSSGTATGLDAVAGSSFTVSRDGEAFQVGTGANLNDENEFGASGWLIYNITAQPNNSNLTFHPGGRMDFNFRLSGSPNECINNGPQICADRDATNSTECNNGTSYGIYISGGNYYTISNAEFVEYTDGTAKFTGHANGLGNIDITFTGRTSQGTPKFSNCLGQVNTGDWYYYTAFSGQVGHLTVSRRGEEFHIGTGGNNQNGGVLGGSGWWEATDGTKGDINILLSGNASDCAGSTTRTQILGLDVALSHGVVDLTWSNNTGDINEGFEIQRSTDGVTFETIETTGSLDNGNTMKFYGAKDAQPLAGVNFYRIKLNYTNGNFDFSETRQVKISDIEDFGLFPNPAQETVNVSLRGYEGRDIEIQLIDQFGKRLKAIQLDNVSDTAYSIDLNNVNNGIYSLWIFTDGKKPVGKKMIVNKMY